MRFVFMDEAGTSAGEPVTIVVGLVVNADVHFMRAEAAVKETLLAVPEPLREKFNFHATEVWASQKYRDIWSMPDRLSILHKMMSLPLRLDIAIAMGMVRRTAPVITTATSHLSKTQQDHLMAFIFCVSQADKYIRDYAALDEVGTIVAEDIPEMRKILKKVPKFLRDNPSTIPPNMLIPTAGEREIGYLTQPGDMFVSRIRDSIHFVEKGVEPILQLADACAYGLRRYFSDQKFGVEFVKSIVGHEPVKSDYDGPASAAIFRKNS